MLPAATFIQSVGRIREGSTIDQARAELRTMLEAVALESPATLNGWTVEAMGLRQAQFGPQTAAVSLLLVAVLALSLIATANLANLTLAEVLARRSDIAVRVALGASRADLLWPEAVKTVLIAGAGAACGLLLTVILLPTLSRSTRPARSRACRSRCRGASWPGGGIGAVDCRILRDRADAPHRRSRYGSGPCRRRPPRRGRTAARAPPVVAARHADGDRDWPADHRRARGRRFRENVADRPGLRSCRCADRAASTPSGRLRIAAEPGELRRRRADAREGDPRGCRRRDDDEPVRAGIRLRHPHPYRGTSHAGRAGAHGAVPADQRGYFRTLRIPQRRGRAFDGRDGAAGLPVAVVSESFARRFWPGEDPIGRRVRRSGPSAPWLTVVGVVGDVHDVGYGQVPEATIDIPNTQNNVATSPVSLVVRAPADPLGFTSAVKAAVWSVDPAQPLASINTLDRFLSDSLGPQRFRSVLLAIFGSLGLLLAAVGIYGVTSRTVVERTREVGVRLALGGRPRQIGGPSPRGHCGRSARAPRQVLRPRWCRSRSWPAYSRKSPAPRLPPPRW